MPYQFENGAGFDATYRNQQVRQSENYGWHNGCDVLVGSSGTAIELDVNAGRVRIDGTDIDIPPQAVQLPTNDSGNPRKDVVYVAADGNAYVLSGDPAVPVPEGAAREQAAVPAPPDTAGLTGVVLAVVWVPAGANDTADLDTTLDIEDRRLPVLAPPTSQRVKETVTIDYSAMAAGDHRSTPVTLPAQCTFNMLAWGVTQIDDGVPSVVLDTNITVQFIHPSGSVLQSSDATRAEADPIFSRTVDTTGPQPYAVRVHNGTTTDFNPPQGLGGYFHFEIVT